MEYYRGWQCSSWSKPGSFSRRPWLFIYNVRMRIINEGNAPREIIDRLEVATLHIDKFWEKKLREERNLVYYPPQVVLFTRNVNTPCGQGLTSFGPFYCARSLYLDVQWFERLRYEYGADEGVFSEFYILGHEIGHHIQEQIGIFSRVISGGPGEESLRVRGELEADAYAGYWARYASEDEDFPWEITEEDIDNALSAAAAVGDDTIHLRKDGVITPEKFGHGSAFQRQSAFLYGYNAQSMFDMKRFWSWELPRLLGTPDHEEESN